MPPTSPNEDIYLQLDRNKFGGPPVLSDKFYHEIQLTAGWMFGGERWIGLGITPFSLGLVIFMHRPRDTMI